MSVYLHPQTHTHRHDDDDTQTPEDWADVEAALLSPHPPRPEDSWELTPEALRFLGRVFDQFATHEEEGEEVGGPRPRVLTRAGVSRLVGV